MFRISPFPGMISGAICCLSLAFASPPVQGQGAPQPLARAQFGIGYVANAPEAMAGASGYVILPRWGGVGLYLDAKFDVSNPTGDRGYDPNVTADQILNEEGGDFIQREGSWWSANAALLRPVTNFMIVYGGAGMARKTIFELYEVELDSGVGVGGVVWAENPGREETRVNLMAGIIMRLSGRVSTHFGFETQPRGLTVGASLRLPRW